MSALAEPVLVDKPHSKNISLRQYKGVLTDDIEVIKTLGDSNFTIYHVYSKNHCGNFALKIFPYMNGQINPSFLREFHLSSLSHPNIIALTEARSLKDLKDDQQISYLLMEVAPYGDISKYIINSSFPKQDEKLVRTYFRQLVAGMEYLHTKGLAHMDLKPGNLLLGDKYVLKIADFDVCITDTEWYVASNGTVNFRPPEVKAKKCNNHQAADIYSAAICLYTLKSGCLPYSENKLVRDHDLQKLLYEDPKSFWHIVEELKHNVENKDFRSLFELMTKKNPLERATLKDIKESKWYKGPVYNPSELEEKMKKILSPIHRTS
jgi:serine/threonine protein kinase